MGQFFQRRPSVPHMNGSDSLFWPTTRRPHMGRSQYPTPSASPLTSSMQLKKSGDGRATPNKLGWAVAEMMYPTPQARDYKGLSTRTHMLPNIALEMMGATVTDKTKRSGIGASLLPLTTCPCGGVCQWELNPRFVEWLMGFPLGWTDCTQSVTPSFRRWRRLHLLPLQNVRV